MPLLLGQILGHGSLGAIDPIALVVLVLAMILVAVLPGPAPERPEGPAAEQADRVRVVTEAFPRRELYGPVVVETIAGEAPGPALRETPEPIIQGAPDPPRRIPRLTSDLAERPSDARPTGEPRPLKLLLRSALTDLSSRRKLGDAKLEPREVRRIDPHGEEAPGRVHQRAGPSSMDGVQLVRCPAASAHHRLDTRSFSPNRRASEPARTFAPARIRAARASRVPSATNPLRDAHRALLHCARATPARR